MFLINKIKKRKKQKQVKKTDLLIDLQNQFPDALEILINYGMFCIGCPAASFETVEMGAKAHGMSDKNIEKMINEINTLLEKDII